MTEATYTAWDGQLYEWPPPQGWYEAWDGQWWPEGYGPQPQAATGTGDGDGTRIQSVDGVVAEGSVVESLVAEDSGAEDAGAEDAVAGTTMAEGRVAEETFGDSTMAQGTAAEGTMAEDVGADSTVAGSSVDQDPLRAGFGPGSDSPADAGDAGESSAGVASAVATTYSSETNNGSDVAFPGTSWAPPGYGSSTDSDSFTHPDDTGHEESSVSAEAVTTGDHTPMTAWAAESGNSSPADLAEPEPESDWTADTGSDESIDYAPEGWSEEIVQGLRDQDSQPDHASFEGTDLTTTAGVSGTDAGDDVTAGTLGAMSDPSAATAEPGTELFARLQAEALQNEITHDDRAGSYVVNDELVSDSAADAMIGLDSAEESTPGVFELDGEPTGEQPVVDAMQPGFTTDFDGADPSLSHDAPVSAEAQAVPAETYEDRGFGETAATSAEAYEDRGFGETAATSAEAYEDRGFGEEAAVPAEAYEDQGFGEEAAVPAEAYEDQGFGEEEAAVPAEAYEDQGPVEAQAVDTQSFDAPSFAPNQTPPAPDAQVYTDPGFGGEPPSDDLQGTPGQPAAQAPSIGFEPARTAVSPMDAPTPSAGSGQRIISILIGVLALVAAGIIGYLAFQLQDNSDDGNGVDQAASEAGEAAAIGSLASPHDPESAIRIEYPDGAETQPWTIQLQSVESDGADGEARLALQIVNDEAQGQGELSDLQLALVDADGNDLASTPSPCGAGDSIDLTATVEAGQSVTGPVCWSVASAPPDTALLAVESIKAQGRVYIALP